MYASLDSVTSTTKRSGLNYMKTRLILMSLVYVFYQFLYKENNNA